MSDSACSDSWVALGLDHRDTLTPRDPVQNAPSVSERSILVNEHFSETNHHKK
jgi:hypothetical protein